MVGPLRGGLATKIPYFEALKNSGKNSVATKLEGGGGKGLGGRATKKYLFCGFPKLIVEI